MLLTAGELAAKLNEFHGGNRICTITTLTPVKMVVKDRDTKEPNPWLNKIDHLQERQVFFGADYETRVNTVLAQTPDNSGFVPYFEAESLWKGRGERINQYLARHKEKGQVYLVYLQACRLDKNVSLRQEAWIDRATGLDVPLEEFARFMPAKSKSKKQERLGVMVETHPRTIKIENVLLIKSIDLDKTGQAEVIQVQRTPDQMSI